MNIDQSIFKAYDIRGTYPDQLNGELAVEIAKAFASVLKPKQIILGTDGRTSGPELKKAVIDTLTDLGISIIDVGLVSSDMYYFACATKELPGIMITASHNPKEYNGFKMVREIPYFFTGDEEIAQMKEMIVSQNYDLPESDQKGEVTEWEIMDGFIQKILEDVDNQNFGSYVVAADTANGMVGPTLEALDGKLGNVKLLPMYYEVDGTFPNHGGDPLEEENRHDIEAKIKEERADFGVMFDPDGDRFFVVDSKGRFIAGDFMTAILSKHYLSMHEHAKIVYDIRASKIVPEAIAEKGGTALYNRVGHSFIKKRMIDEGAVFGGEVSGHYYFKDFFYCDSGILTFLVLLDYLSKTKTNLTELIDQLETEYFISGEINSTVDDVPAILQRLEETYGEKANEVLNVDGVSMEFDEWRFNVRSSNTQPLIRLNLEATTDEMMQEKRDEVLALIRS